MKLRLLCWIVLSAIALAPRANADDQQKAEKELKKVTAMACDVSARAIVSRTMADMLELKRDQLVRERRAMNLNYGLLFLAHELNAKGMAMLPIALQLQQHKTLLEIANDQRVDWRLVLGRAKKLNDKIEDNIYKHFLNPKAGTDRDALEKYDAKMDWVKLDSDATQQDIVDAQEIFVHWRDRASYIGGKGNKLTASQELASQRIKDRTAEMRVPPPRTTPR